LLNVDLDVYSTEPLDVLADALAQKVDVHYVGREGRRFSLHCGLVLSPFPPLDAAMRAWLKVLARLPKPAKAVWLRAQRRELNIGLRSQRQAAVDEMIVKPATLGEIARLGATIAVTLYPIRIVHNKKRGRTPAS
jgi:hypothetical protein